MSKSAKGRLVLAAVAALTAAALVATALAGPRDKKRGGVESATAKLRDADGRTVGRVKLRENRRGTVRVSVRARRLTPGFHGFHIHETGVCEAPSEDSEGETGDFLSAGGHFKRGAQEHGAHAGDMPPLFVRRNGRTRATFLIDSYGVNELTKGDGSAIMIHTGRDNAGNIPDRYVSSESGEPGPDEDTLATGDSGDRAACGVARSRR
jgi:Cu-Zn family superoxide dismutase